MNEAMRRLRDAAPVAELMREAQQAAVPVALPANAHIHLPPNFSAFESITQAVELAAAQGLRLLGASNYYEYSIYDAFAAGCLAKSVFPLFGLEIIALLDEIRDNGELINDPGNPGKMYLCGKGITRFEDMTPEAGRLVDRIRQDDAGRMREITRRVARCFSAAGVRIDLEDSDIIERVVRRHGVLREHVVLQERHVAQAFQEECFRIVPEAARAAVLARVMGARLKASPADGVRVQNEIRGNLMKTGKPAFVEEHFLSFDEARRLVLELGGIPCYPTLADGATPVCGYEDPPEKLVRTLWDLGVHCAEFIPVRNQPGVLERYVRAFRSAGFVITAGTEHNTLDLIPMLPACAGGVPIPAELKGIFAEGACVTVAHQFLNLHGRPGYVDAAGRLNGDFSDAEERIAFFHRLGAEIIRHTGCVA